MSTRVRIGAIGLTDEQKRRIHEIPGLFAEAARTTVLERIWAGLNVFGGSLLDGLDRYSAGYERWKGGSVIPRIKKRKDRATRVPPKAGRALYTPGDRFVMTGAMLRAWRVISVTNLRAICGFTSTREALKALGNHVLRPTFSLAKHEVDSILSGVLERMGFNKSD